MRESKYVVVAYTKTKTNVLKDLNLCIHEVKDEVREAKNHDQLLPRTAKDGSCQPEGLR